MSGKNPAPTTRLAVPAGLLLLLLLGLSDAWGDAIEDRRKEVLARIPEEPDLLINLAAWELPATSDMVKLGKAATGAMVQGLINNMDAGVRASCASVLNSTRDPLALDALLAALDDPDYAVQAQALGALGSIESRQATPRLLALLRKPGTPSYVRDEAVRTLGRLGDPAAAAPLVRYFRETWDPAAQRALWDLREHLATREIETIAVEPLRPHPQEDVPFEVIEFSIDLAGRLRLRAAAAPVRALAERESYFQNDVIHSLGLIGDRSQVPYLRGLLDQTAEARLLNNVVFALDRLGEDTEPFLRQALRDRRAYIRFNAAFVAGDLGAATLADELTVALRDPNDFVRSEVAVALGKIAAPESVPALEAASAEVNPVVRRDALLALDRIDHERYVDRVIAELVASDLPAIRSRAIGRLAEQRDPRIVGPVLAALDPSSWEDEEVALGLLERFDDLDSPEATAFLLRVASDYSYSHRALVLLARFHDERSRFVLRQWLSQPGGEQNQILRAMGLFRDAESLPAARRWMQGKEADAALHGAFVVASLGDVAGMDLLIDGIEEAPPELKRTAATLLTQIDPAAIPGQQDRIAALLHHEDVMVRLYAARVLAERGEARAFDLLHVELAKRVPFIRDEVIDIVERAPRAHAEPVLREWIDTAGPILRADLERVLERD